MSLLNRGQVLIKTVWYANCPSRLRAPQAKPRRAVKQEQWRQLRRTPAAYECSVGLPWLQYSGVVQVVAFRRPHQPRLVRTVGSMLIFNLSGGYKL